MGPQWQDLLRLAAAEHDEGHYLFTVWLGRAPDSHSDVATVLGRGAMSKRGRTRHSKKEGPRIWVLRFSTDTPVEKGRAQD